VHRTLRSAIIPYWRWLISTITVLLCAQTASPAQTNPPSTNDLPVVNLTKPVSPASWPLPEPFKLTAEDLDYGEKQVEQMVHDRPALARAVNKQSPIWQWCVRHFAGASLGYRVSWNSDSPELPGLRCDHQLSRDGVDPSLRFTEFRSSRDEKMESVKASNYDLWSRAVYELNNMENDPEFARVWADACAGKLTRNEFIIQYSRPEHVAYLKTALVYEHLWKKTWKSEIDAGRYWYVGTPRTYEAWMSRFKDRSKYPWSNYGAAFDNKVVPYLKSIGIVPKRDEP
jgi:hypothetical protein